MRGQPVRIRLIDRFADGGATVQELMDAVCAAQQNVSQHLGILRRAGCLIRRRHGISLRYELADQHVRRLSKPDETLGGWNLGSSLLCRGLVIQATVGSAGGRGGRRTNRSGVAA